MPSAAASSLAPSRVWTACRCCAMAQPLPPPVRGYRRVCRRCGTSFGSGIADTEVALAFAITALLLFALAQFYPLMGIEMEGVKNSIRIGSGVIGLERHDFASLAVVVLMCSVGLPMFRLLALIYVLAGLRMRARLPGLIAVFRLCERLQSWAMMDVFLLGAFVAFTKLRGLADVDIGTGFWGLGLLVIATVALDAALDRRAIWDALSPPPLFEAPPERGAWISCHDCQLLQEEQAQSHCARCGARLHRRKADSLGRTCALVLAGFILYIPANFYPVMTVISFGRGTSSTILGGVRELVAANDWPLALIVFTASIAVPLLKLFTLIWLLLSVWRRSRKYLTQRTRLFRAIEFVGRWSNIDVFVTAMLTALVTLGNIATVEPGNGVLAFGAVVVLTMLATESFDPRLIWDAAEMPHG